MRLRGILTFNNKAQISVEYILIVGLLLSMILIVYPYALKENELNKALAAARDGATYGASLRGMGFRGEGARETPEGIIKAIGIRYSVTNTVSPETNKIVVEVYIDASLPSYITGNDKLAVGRTIERHTKRYIAYAFSGVWYPMTLNLPYLKETSGSYYTFNVNYPNWV